LILLSAVGVGVSRVPKAAEAASPDIVISQVYGGGGNSGATYTHDFIELFNRGTAPASLNGWSLQYSSATGTGLLGGSTTLITELPNVVVQPGQYYLVQEASTASVGIALPAPDLVDATPIAMAAGAGKVAVVASTAGLGCNGGSTPCNAAQLGLIVDLVGYGNANFFEGLGGAPALTNTTAAVRALGGCQDTDSNGADFASATPAPRNSASALTLCDGGDSAPAVTSTDPANGSTNVAVSTNVTVAFSEEVVLEAGAVTLECPAGSTVFTSAASGPDDQFVFDPAANLPAGTLCLGIVAAGLVSDTDSDDPPNTMGADFTFSFSTLAEDVCEAPFTAIPAIQGTGAAAAIVGTVTTQGVVVGDFQTSSGLSGFYLQDAVGDGDTNTSDGIFVFTGSTSDTVAAGDLVRVTGFARERFSQTAINGSNSNTAAVPEANIVNCGSGSVLATDVFLPQPIIASGSTFVPDMERYEGMLVRLPQDLVIAEYFNYERFGEIVLSLPLAGEDRPFTGTALDEPGAAANARTAANQGRRITLDDGLGFQNPEFLRHPNGEQFGLDNRFRGGDLVTNTTGVLGFDFDLYRIQPTAPAEYTAVNPRQAAPSPVGGSLRISAMNALNYFVTGDYPSGDPLDNKCGPNQNVECRGHDADQPLEFQRQHDKLIQALLGLDSDIVGLNEVENTQGVEPLASIVAGLNAVLGAGTYSYIDTGVIGTDAIRVGIIYKPGKVSPLGDYEVLDSSVDPAFIDTRNRPVLAQTFRQNNNGSVVTVAVTHLKSKGSACTPDDPDLFDGQGNCSQTRKNAAEALIEWLATDPTGSGDPDFLIIGDMNSYAQEQAIDSVLAGPDDLLGTSDDYVNLALSRLGNYAYSYLFDGQFGYLDYALASASLASQVTGVTDWHINADEPDVFDYDTSFKGPAQEALFESNPFRSSDHDPVVVGLNLAVCSNLGDNSSRFFPDADGFTFHGSAGERVTVRLEQKNPANSGRASLIVSGPLFLKVNTSALPNEVSGVLPFTGTYSIRVSELFGAARFVGDYCLKVTSTGNAGGTVVPTAITE